LPSTGTYCWAGRRDWSMPQSDAGLLGVALGERVAPHPLGRLVVLALDVLLQPRALHTPLAAAPDLDGGQLAAAHHVVDLRVRHVELGGDVGQEQEPRLHGDSLVWLRSLQFAIIR